MHTFDDVLTACYKAALGMHLAPLIVHGLGVRGGCTFNKGRRYTREERKNSVCARKTERDREGKQGNAIDRGRERESAGQREREQRGEGGRERERQNAGKHRQQTKEQGDTIIHMHTHDRSQHQQGTSSDAR